MMDVKTLHAELSKLIAEGLGKYPVKLQEVVDGFTSGRDVEISQGDPADGKVVWIYVKENDHRQG